jgi:hypothetical protein
VIFYTLTSCVNNRPVNLTIDNSEYFLIYAFFSVPDCETPGTTTVSLPQGIHTWEATCEQTGTTNSGTVNVITNSCSLVELQ